MVRPTAGLRENRQDVFQGLLELRNKFFASESLFGVPPYLASNEHDATCRNADAIRIADWRKPAGRVQNLHWDPGHLPDGPQGVAHRASLVGRERT